MLIGLLLVRPTTIQVLTNLRGCSIDEVTRQAAYFPAIPVNTVADALLSGQARLSRASLCSLHDLGTLATIFGTLGTERPQPRQERFTVMDVMQVLESKRADPKMLGEIKGFMASDANDVVDYNITIVRSSIGLTLIDGNKRNIAFFERRRGIETPIDFAVWVVDGIELGA